MTRYQSALLIFTILLLAFFNQQIWQKEAIKTHGETLYIKLAPVDPRAFMLGDYMQLRYQPTVSERYSQRQSPIVITLNQDHVIIKSHTATTGTKSLTKNQRLLNIRQQLKPERFYFQEGHEPLYRNATYGVFKYRDPNNFLLLGLANDDRQLIDPKITINHQ